MARLIVIGNGKNRSGDYYSKLVPIVTTKEGSEYLDLKNPTYVDKLHPILKEFISDLQEA